MPARRRGGGGAASRAGGRPVVPQSFSGAFGNNNGIGAGTARSVNVSGVGEGDWLADPVNNQLAFKVRGVFLISLTLTFAAQANETYEPSLGINGATGKFERLWASRKLVERSATGNISVDLAAIVYVDKADDDASEEIGVSILNDSLAGHSIVNFDVSDMDVVSLGSAGPAGRNAPVLSDAEIGDKAFSNPPSDLSDAEKATARGAIGAGTGEGADQTARDAAAAAAAAAMSASAAAGTNAAAIAALAALVGDGSLIREEFAGMTGATTAEETVPGVTVIDSANAGYALRVEDTTEFQLGNALRAARANTAIAVNGVNFYSNGDGDLLLTKDAAAISNIAVWVVRDISAIRAAIAAVGGGGGAAITVEDEGTPLATAATVLNFVGTGVAVTGEGAEKTITIPGGGGLAQVGTTWIATAQNNGNFRDTGIALPASPNDNAVYALASAFGPHGGTFSTISGAQIKALATVVAGASAGGMEIGGDPVSAETLFAAKLASGNLALRNDGDEWAAGNYAALYDLSAGDSSSDTPSTPGGGTHDRLIGWSAAAVPTQAEIDAADTEQDNVLAIPKETDDGHIFFAVPVSVGAPNAAYYDGNTHDILGGFTQRANAGRGGTAYLVWSTNAAQSAAIMGTGRRTLTLSYATR